MVIINENESKQHDTSIDKTKCTVKVSPGMDARAQTRQRASIVMFTNPRMETSKNVQFATTRCNVRSVSDVDTHSAFRVYRIGLVKPVLCVVRKRITFLKRFKTG